MNKDKTILLNTDISFYEGGSVFSKESRPVTLRRLLNQYQSAIWLHDKIAESIKHMGALIAENIPKSPHRVPQPTTLDKQPARILGNNITKCIMNDIVTEARNGLGNDSFRNSPLYHVVENTIAQYDSHYNSKTDLWHTAMYLADNAKESGDPREQQMSENVLAARNKLDKLSTDINE